MFVKLYCVFFNIIYFLYEVLIRMILKATVYISLSSYMYMCGFLTFLSEFILKLSMRGDQKVHFSPNFLITPRSI